MIKDFNRTIPDDLAFIYILRHNWAENNDDPSLFPPMLCRAFDSLEFRLVPRLFRYNLFYSEVSEFNSIKQLPWISFYPGFPSVAKTVLNG